MSSLWWVRVWLNVITNAFFDMVERPDSVSFKSITTEVCGFNVAGPNSRELLQGLTDADLSSDNFRFTRSKRITLAGMDAIAIRVSFTGDLGFEIYVPEEQQLELYDTLLEAGKPYNIRPVGGRSLLSLRIEKGYGSWGREYSPEYWPQEVGLERLIKLDKPEFIGREAYLKIKDNEPREKLVMIEIETSVADAVGSEPIFLPDGTPVGRISSGSYGHSVEKSLALGFVKTAHAAPGTALDVAVLGQSHKAVILEGSAFDPEGQRLRS